MKENNEDIKVAALRSAARAIMSHNDELAAHLDRGVAIFTESPPISERLKCESNGAHKFIEDFATALKALPRGCGPVQLAMTEVKVSCIDLVLKIRETEKLLPPSVTESDRRTFLDRIELAINEETIFANLAIGVSGAAPNCPHRQYCRRIDNSVNSIKKHLTQLNIAIQHIERDIRQAAEPADPPPVPNGRKQSPSEPSEPKRRKRRAGTSAWRQKDAAALLGISTRQLRSYKTNPPDPYWPGWEDPVKLKTWLNAREGGARMAKAIKHHLPLREGGITERGMDGSSVPARRS